MKITTILLKLMISVIGVGIIGSLFFILIYVTNNVMMYIFVVFCMICVVFGGVFLMVFPHSVYFQKFLNVEKLEKEIQEEKSKQTERSIRFHRAVEFLGLEMLKNHPKYSELKDILNLNEEKPKKPVMKLHKETEED